MEVLLITAAVSQVKLYLKCLSAESVYVYVVHQCRLLLTMDWINDIVTVCLSVTLAVCVRVFMNISTNVEDRFGSMLIVVDSELLPILLAIFQVYLGLPV